MKSNKPITADMQILWEIIQGVRHFRSLYKISSKVSVPLYLPKSLLEKLAVENLEAYIKILKKQANLSGVQVLYT